MGKGTRAPRKQCRRPAATCTPKVGASHARYCLYRHALRLPSPSMGVSEHCVIVFSCLRASEPALRSSPSVSLSPVRVMSVRSNEVPLPNIESELLASRVALANATASHDASMASGSCTSDHVTSELGTASGHVGAQLHVPPSLSHSRRLATAAQDRASLAQARFASGSLGG